jgi:hypothetical protein
MTNQKNSLEDLFRTWKALLARHGVTPDSEDLLRALPPADAERLLGQAISRLSGASR